MSEVSTWRLLAYMDNDPDGVLDESRTLAEWQIEDVIRWCQHRGYDNIYLCRTDTKTLFTRRPAPESVRHHMHLVDDGPEAA